MRRVGLLVALVLALSATACGTTVPDAQRKLAASGGAGSGLTRTRTTNAAGEVIDEATGQPLDEQPSDATTDTAPTSGGTDTPGATVGPGTSRATTRPGATLPPANAPANTKPIKVGFLRTITDGNAGAGVNTGTTIDQTSAQDAVIAGQNDLGGLAGRKIVPVFHDIHQTDTDSAAVLAAACQRFTRDDKVELVIAINGDEAFERCLAKAGIPHISPGPVGYAAALRGALPGTATVTGLDLERRQRLLVEQLNAVGWLVPERKLGVLVDGCADTQSAYKSTFLPTVSRLKLTVADTVEVTCASGYGDLGSISTQMQTAIVRFRRNSVDRVVVLSDVSPTYMILFGTAAESQGYRPGYALDTTSQAAVLANGNVPAAQMANVRVAGWLPVLDVSANKQPPKPPALLRCIATLQKRGLEPQSTGDLYYAASSCDPVSTASAVLAATKGQTTTALVRSAIERLGTIEVAGTIEGRATLSSAHRDGAVMSRVAAFDTACGCMQYISAPRPIP